MRCCRQLYPNGSCIFSATVVNSFWNLVWLPLLVGLVFSFGVERALKPSVSWFWQRQPASLVLHVCIWLLTFAFELAIFQRPWFAAIVALTLLIVLVLVNNAKVHTLREPFLFQDFEYFIDTLRHPRLYLPFFGVRKALLATFAFLLALMADLQLESPLTVSVATDDFLIGLTVLALPCLLLPLTRWSRTLPVSFVAAEDLRQLGLVASLWRYAEEERHTPSLASPYVTSTIRQPDPLPHLVVVQSESFIDLRQWTTIIRPEILARFDALTRTAIAHGKVAVPAWGANTVRTEYAFLSGLTEDQLGVHRFNPYRKLARAGIRTLVHLLREQGYRTVCVHPYPASFYGRDSIFPVFGFDTFLDIRSFHGAEKNGPYVSDVAVADKVCDLLRTDLCQPHLFFVITMENHGPLHWEKVAVGDEERLYASSPPAGCEDLTVYLRHLANADRMAGILGDHLASLAHPAWLCWYGDHVPIMPTVYSTLGLPDGRTDYLLWSNQSITKGSVGREDIRIEQLGQMLLRGCGLLE